MGGWSDGLLGHSVDARKSVSARFCRRMGLRRSLMPSGSVPSSVAMRRMRLAPMISPRLPYSSVPQHHGISCVPNSE